MKYIATVDSFDYIPGTLCKKGDIVESEKKLPEHSFKPVKDAVADKAAADKAAADKIAADKAAADKAAADKIAADKAAAEKK